MIKRYLGTAVLASLMATTMALPVLADTANDNSNSNVNTNTNSNTNVNSNTNTNSAVNPDKPNKGKRGMTKEEKNLLKEQQRLEKEKLKEQKKLEEAAATAAMLACMQTAVTTRETALLKATEARYTAHKAALGSRKTALVEAWKLTDLKARRTAIKTAGVTYQKSLYEANKAFRAEKRAAWKQFYTDRKTCKANGNSGDAMTEGADASL